VRHDPRLRFRERSLFVLSAMCILHSLCPPLDFVPQSEVCLLSLAEVPVLRAKHQKSIANLASNKGKKENPCPLRAKTLPRLASRDPSNINRTPKVKFLCNPDRKEDKAARHPPGFAPIVLRVLALGETSRCTRAHTRAIGQVGGAGDTSRAQVKEGQRKGQKRRYVYSQRFPHRLQPRP